MSSSRNAPEWFGGGGGGMSATTVNNGRSRSSSNGSRRNSSRKSTDGTSTSLGGSKSERRKKSSHKRKKSRELISTTESLNDSPQEPNYPTYHAPIEVRQSKDTSRRKARDGGGEEKSEFVEKSKLLNGKLTKKPSFVERLLGISSIKRSSFQKLDAGSKGGSKARPIDDISVMNTSGSQKNKIGTSRKNRNSNATPATHRRVHSDSTDLSHYSMSMSLGMSSSKETVHQTTTVAQPVTSAHAQSAQVAPACLVDVKDAGKDSYSVDTSAPMDYSGIDNDPLDYSEDESTTAQPRPLHPIQMQMPNPLNPYQQSYRNENHESQQILYHQRIMALAPSRQVSSFTRLAAHPYYGATNPVADYSRPRSTSPVNEFYISEDETLMSETSRSRKTWHNSFVEQRSLRESQNDADNAIPEEDEDFAESTALLTESTLLLSPLPPTKSILNSSSSVKSNNSNSTNGGNGKNVTILSPPALSLTSGNSNYSGSDKGRKMQHSAPPPIQSFSFQLPSHNRTISTGTETTGSTSMYSPHNGLLVKNMAMQQLRAHTRKEQKRLLRKLENMEEKEERIQSIIRSGHSNALDWSQHVSQRVRGLNLAAGFFPREDFKTHDVPFALLFLAQLCFVLYLAITFASDTVMSSSTFDENSHQTIQSYDNSNYNDDPFSTEPSYSTGVGSTVSNWARDVHVDYANAFKLACITALYATSLSALFIGMMMILGKALIPTTLCLSIILCIAFATIGIALSPYSFIPITGIIALALSVGYSIVVWDRIPFAATNLDTALCGVKCTADVLIVGWIMMIAAFFWTIAWTVSFLGIYDNYLDCITGDGTSYSVTYSGVCIYVAMISSYLWTINVFMNIIHVTVAGVVATWWSEPDTLLTCCNSVLRENFVLSLTSSFGSICLGSFMSPLLALLKAMLYCCNSYSTSHHPLRANPGHESVMSAKRGEQSVMSDPSNLAQLPVVSSPLDSTIKYFNDYGFTYVGIYREKFSESSRKATEVFETREWVGVVSDQLVGNILRLIITAITLGTGCLGLVVEEFDGYSFTNFQQPTYTAFMIGCFIGVVISSVCLKVVASSVNTILVCFALAPWKFQMNHPGLSKEMRESWGGIWLDEYDWLDASENGDIGREEMMR